MEGLSVNIKEVEAKTILGAILRKKEIYKDDINGFLNSLSEEEFAIYMQYSEKNGEDLWNTGRENITNVYLEGEDKTDKKEQQFLQASKDEEILRENMELIESQNQINLNVFEAVPFQDFYKLFDLECFDNLPLFVKLFFLKEVMQYNSLYENTAFKTMTLFLTSANYAYYYFMRYIYFSNKVKLLSFPRFFVLFLVSDFLYTEAMVKSHYLNNHLVDINPLLNTDDLFMYEDPYYKALIKRVISNYPHLVNDNYDFTQILEEKSEIYDKYFAGRGSKIFDPS